MFRLQEIELLRRSDCVNRCVSHRSYETFLWFLCITEIYLLLLNLLQYFYCNLPWPSTNFLCSISLLNFHGLLYFSAPKYLHGRLSNVFYSVLIFGVILLTLAFLRPIFSSGIQIPSSTVVNWCRGLWGKPVCTKRAIFAGERMDKTSSDDRMLYIFPPIITCYWTLWDVEFGVMSQPYRGNVGPVGILISDE